MRVLLEAEQNLNEIWKVIHKEFQKACVAKRHPFRYVVLSTSKDGNATSRWVVLRKFTEQLQFLIYTDARSGKVEELRTNDTATLLFYNDRKKLQVKVVGKTKIHQQNEITKKYWPGVNASSAKSYTTKLAPGTPITNKEQGYEWLAPTDDTHFTVLEINPTQIEALQLNGDLPIRVQYVKENKEWKSTFLVP